MIAVIGIEMSSKKLVSGPDIFSRGFIGEEYGDELVEDAKDIILTTLEQFSDVDSVVEFDEIKASCRKKLAKFVYERTRRRPVIVPIVMEV